MLSGRGITQHHTIVVCPLCVTMDIRAGKGLEGLYSVVVAYNLHFVNWFNTVYQELES